jgi:SET domain-containing protein
MPQTPALAFEVRDSVIAGKGAFAIRPINKGEQLIEYVGEIITHPEADERYDDESMDEHHTFLFTITSRLVIDATTNGNESRFINHSCDPNCEAEITKGRVFISAIRDIAEGEELHYDYGYERSGDETEEDERRYRCVCGTAKCRGSIMEPVQVFKARKRAAAARRAARKRAAAAQQTPAKKRPGKKRPIRKQQPAQKK